jgi:hypothetical protein
MTWLRQHIWTVIILGAIVLSFAVSNHESTRRDSAQRAQLVTGCIRSSERSVLDAAYKQTTSDVRRAAGTKPDIQAANMYQRFALGGLKLVPLPESSIQKARAGSVDIPDALKASIQVGHDVVGDEIYELTPSAHG